ncbi:MAG: inositol monophosphatase family protein [Actinomycetes bacterium]
MNQDLEFANYLADLAAGVTMAAFGFGERQSVERKADRTVVTATDQLAERVIRAAVRAEYPDDGVRGEEDGLAQGGNDRIWVIDPIDGTRMFAEGIPMWTTLIALRTAGEVVVGVADAPALGERVTAVRGEGAWSEGRQLHVSSVATLADAFVLHASVEEFVEEGQLDGLVRLVTSTRGSRGMADAWGHLLVARGAADVLVEASECFEWDWAATGLILSEAGGAISAVRGGSPTDGCRLLATNGLLDDQVRAVLGHGSDTNAARPPISP